jgi:phenol hydroxylase P3 protein
VQSWLPVNQIYQGNCFRPGADPSVPGFDPLLEVLHYYGFHVGEDGGEFQDSPDCKNWERWTGRPGAAA